MPLLNAAIAVEADRVREMFGSIAHRYDLGNTVLSLGIHHLWRRTLLGLAPSDPEASALDVATGTGDLLPLLRKRYKRVLGLDFCLPMLHLAAQKSQENQRSILQGDGLCMPFSDNTFDIITIAFGVRNFENLQRGLQEIRRVLRPGGCLLVLEFGQPRIPILAGMYQWYSTHIMPRIGGFVTGNQAAYTYLPQTAGAFPCGAAFENELNAAGLQSDCTRALTAGIAYAYRAIKPQADQKSAKDV